MLQRNPRPDMGDAVMAARLHTMDRETAESIAAGFLAARQAKHLDFRMEAEDEGDGKPPAGGAPTATDESFPANTPWQDMTPGQQVNYWRHQARRHEGRAKAFGDLTPEQLTELRERAKKQEATEYELASAAEKAVADAKSATQAEADARYLPKLVAAEFRAAAAGRIEAERLEAILEPLDRSKFLTSSGDVDADKVSAFIDGIAPAKDAERQRRGPSPEGHGRRESTTTGSSVASGRDLYRARHPQKTT